MTEEPEDEVEVVDSLDEVFSLDEDDPDVDEPEQAESPAAAKAARGAARQKERRESCGMGESLLWRFSPHLTTYCL